jgi:hypothetical protein
VRKLTFQEPPHAGNFILVFRVEEWVYIAQQEMDEVWAPSAKKYNWKAMDAEVAESKAEDVVDVVVPQDLLALQEEERARKRAANDAAKAAAKAATKLAHAEERARKKAASDAAKAAAKLAHAEERARRKAASDAAKKMATEKTLKKNAATMLALAEAKKAALDVAKSMAKEKALRKNTEARLALTEAKLALTQKVLEKVRRGKAPLPASEKPPTRGRKRNHENLENFVQCEKCLKWRSTDREWEEEELYRCGNNQRDCNEPEDKEDV